MPWRQLHLGPRTGAVDDEAIELFGLPWLKQGETPLDVHVPDEPQMTVRLNRYFAQSKGRVIQFAAGEVASGIWLIYLNAPDHASRLLAARVASYPLAGVGAFLVWHGLESQPHIAFLGAIIIVGAFWLERWAKAQGSSSAA